MTCLFHFSRMIQVTSAGAENGSPHRAPPKGAAVTGVQVYVEECVLARTRAATVYHTSALHCACVCTHALLCVLHCVCVCVCVCIMTVILYDRMITPLSPQLRGVSQLRSSPSTAPKELLCFHICQSQFPVGSNTPLHLILSLLPASLPAHIISKVFPTLNK